MTEFKEKDFIRTIRKGNRELYVSLPLKFLKEHNLQDAKEIDLRIFGQLVKENNLDTDN